jgi:hypothetical protein
MSSRQSPLRGDALAQRLADDIDPAFRAAQRLLGDQVWRLRQGTTYPAEHGPLGRSEVQTPGQDGAGL